MPDSEQQLWAVEGAILKMLPSIAAEISQVLSEWRCHNRFPGKDLVAY